MEEWKEIVLPKEVETLDEKYSYQIDENSVVHLFRGEEDCQKYLKEGDKKNGCEN